MMEELQDFVDTATNSPLLSGCKAFRRGASCPHGPNITANLFLPGHTSHYVHGGAGDRHVGVVNNVLFVATR